MKAPKTDNKAESVSEESKIRREQQTTARQGAAGVFPIVVQQVRYYAIMGMHVP